MSANFTFLFFFVPALFPHARETLRCPCPVQFMEIDQSSHNAAEATHVKTEEEEASVKAEPDDPSHSWGNTTSGNQGQKGGSSGDKAGNDDDDASEDEGEDVYEVERVVGHQHVPGTGLYYFLKWKGYDEKDNTWEPEHSVFCHGYVSEYWTRYEALGGKKSDRTHLEQEPQKERRKSLTSSGKGSSNEADQGALLPDLTPLLDQARPPVYDLAAIATTIPPDGKSGESAPLKPLGKNRSKQQAKSRSKPNSTSTAPIKTESATHKSDSSSSKRKRTRESDDWAPPASLTSWEDEVETIDTVERRQIAGEDELVVHLVWKSGKKTEHLTRDIRRKCPQKLLDFYEGHLIFREEPDE